MKKVSDVLDTITSFGKENSAAILTGTAVVGLIVTSVSAYRAGLKAHDILHTYHEDMKYVKKGDKEASKEVKIETMKKIVPIVAPPVIMGVATAACTIGSHSVSRRKIAALSAVYTLSEKTVTDLNEKMKEMLGEKKTKQIKDAILKDKLDADPVTEHTEIIETGLGNVLCKDDFSGRYFRSNADNINKAIHLLSARARTEVYVTVNDFYQEIDLEPNGGGRDIGWLGEDTLDTGLLPIYFTALLTDRNEPCLCISFENLRDV